jgi:hypothetical protein
MTDRLDPLTNGAREGRSIGELLGDISGDLSQLFRNEVDLAKSEMKAEAIKAGRAAGSFGAAGLAGWMAVLMLSLALMFALGSAMPWGWAALIVAVLWAASAAVFYTNGRSKMRQVDPVPHRTVESLKEDAEWLKHPTG